MNLVPIREVHHKINEFLIQEIKLNTKDCDVYFFNDTGNDTHHKINELSIQENKFTIGANNF